MMHRLMPILWVGLLIPAVALADLLKDNFYIDLVRRSDPGVEEIAKAIEQLEDGKPVEIIEEISVRSFHKRVEPIENNRRPLCLSCHHALPHAKSERSRTFLNMHSRYISCESCHLHSSDVKFNYRWVAYNEPWAGQIIDNTASIHTGADQARQSIVPRPGAHIAPFNGGRPAYALSDHPYVSEIKKIWEQGTIEQRAELKARLHQPLKEEGRKCNACHEKKNNLLDMTLLGVNERQLYQLTSNSIVRFFDRYQKDDERLRITDLLR